jgi:LPS-assembly protein
MPIRRFSLLVTLILIFFLSPNCLIAQESSSFSLSEEAPKTPWHVQADRIQTDQEIKLLEAWGSVRLYKGEDYIQADYVRYYWSTRWVYLRGNVQARWEGDYFEAQEAEFDLDNKVGWVKNGQLFLKGPHLYFKGKRLEKTGKNTYSFKQAEVTACDGERPAWTFKSAQGEITMGGYARLWNNRFQVKKHSVLYTPYMVLPVKKKRQSGFLLPELHTSSRLGAGLNLPYYWAKSPEEDLTFYFNYMHKAGLMLGTEYRHTPNVNSKGVWHLDWLYDKRAADTESEEPQQFDDDGLIRPNHNRFWLRSKFDGFLFNPDWKTKLDLDYVSDQNYLREFEEGYSGFEESRELFLEEFGRDIADADDLKRTSTWLVSKNWSHYGFSSRFEYTQNLRFDNDNLDPDQDNTLQRLPELNFNIYQHSLADTAFDWEAQNEMTYFWRRFGTRGLRLDLYPQVSLPLESDYFSLIPKLGWRETVYAIDQFENEPQKVNTDDHYLSRGIWDFEATAFSEFYRIYSLKSDKDIRANKQNLGISFWDKIKHSLQPKLKYQYTPNMDQSDLPEFDSLDHIEAQNELTYSITNILTRRSKKVVPIAADNDSGYELSSNYLDFLRLELEQSYDLDEADREKNLDKYPKRPFTDIRMELSLRPQNWLNLQSTTWFSPYLSTITEHEHILRTNFFDNKASAYCGLDFLKELENDIHRQDQEALNILRFGGELKLGKPWKVALDYEQDLEKSELVERTFELSYTHQCWALEWIFKQTPDDTRLEVKIKLLNLGAVEEGYAMELL